MTTMDPFPNFSLDGLGLELGRCVLSQIPPQSSSVNRPWGVRFLLGAREEPRPPATPPRRARTI